MRTLLAAVEKNEDSTYRRVLSYDMFTGAAVYHALHPTDGLQTHVTWEGILTPAECEWVAQEALRRNKQALLAAEAAAVAALQQLA